MKDVVVSMKIMKIKAPTNTGFLAGRLPPLRSMIVALFTWLALFSHGEAFATYLSNCSGPAPGSFSFALPTDVRLVPRNNTGIYRVGPWTQLYVGGTNVWTCDGYADGPLATPTTYLGTAYKSNLVPTGGTYTENGVNYPIYQTNVAGIGMVMGSSTYTSGQGAWQADLSGKPIGYPVGATWTPGGGWANYTWNSGGGPPYYYAINGMAIGMRMDFAFIKIGTVTGGTINMPGVVAQAAATAYQNTWSSPVFVAGPLLPANVMLTGGPTFAVAACETPDVTVDLGTHANTEFSGGVGATSAAASFNIRLNNCPVGINTVKYQVDALTTVINPTQSVVALDSNSTAGNVGVQLLDSNSSPLPLGTQLGLATYNSAGGDFTIPLKARYYRTSGAPVTAGSANSVMTFTINYQ